MPPKADKLLKRLRQSKNGWSAKDLVTLYDYFGFIIRSGSKHDIITHPDFPELSDMLPRGSGELSPDYARDAWDALKSIEKVLAKQAIDEQEQAIDEDDKNHE